MWVKKSTEFEEREGGRGRGGRGRVGEGGREREGGRGRGRVCKRGREREKKERKREDKEERREGAIARYSLDVNTKHFHLQYTQTFYFSHHNYTQSTAQLHINKVAMTTVISVVQVKPESLVKRGGCGALELRYLPQEQLSHVLDLVVLMEGINVTLKFIFTTTILS